MTLDITKPLQFDGCDNYGNVYQIHDGIRQVAIVDVCADIEGTPRHDHGRAETDSLAYTKLFTAAPDMLKVLKRARQYVIDGTLREADDDYTGRLVLDALDAPSRGQAPASKTRLFPFVRSVGF